MLVSYYFEEHSIKVMRRRKKTLGLAKNSIDSGPEDVQYIFCPMHLKKYSNGNVLLPLHFECIFYFSFGLFLLFFQNLLDLRQSRG